MTASAYRTAAPMPPYVPDPLPPVRREEPVLSAVEVALAVLWGVGFCVATLAILNRLPIAGAP